MSNVEDIAIRLISLAGDANGQIMHAFTLANSGNFYKGEAALKKATELLLQAREIETKELLPTAADPDAKIPFALVSHAQDYLATATMMRSMAADIIHLSARIHNEL